MLEQANKNLYLLYLALAGLSLLLTLPIPFLNEESVFSTLLLDMHMHHHWLQPQTYGEVYPRPPLMIWLSYPIAAIVGWDNALLANRLLIAATTLATTLGVYGFARSLFPHKHTAYLASICYLAGDVLFKRGWLAVADPLFAAFTFASIAALYLSVMRQSVRWFSLSLVLVFLAFMSKHANAYLFYAISGLCLLSCAEGRRFLLRPGVILLGISALALPGAWFIYKHYMGLEAYDVHRYLAIYNDWPTWRHAMTKLFGHYILRNNLLFLLPLLVFFVKRGPVTVATRKHLHLLSAIVFMNFIPYLVIDPYPGGNAAYIRYFLPLAPCVALLIGHRISRCRIKTQRAMVFSLLLTVILKCGLTLAGLTLFHGKLLHYHEFSYRPAANYIYTRTQHESICLNEYMPEITGHLHKLRWPAPPLNYANRVPESACDYLISYAPKVSGSWQHVGEIASSYRRHGHALWRVHLWQKTV